MNIQWKTNKELVENLLHEYFKAWGLKCGDYCVYVHKNNVLFVENLLEKHKINFQVKMKVNFP